MKNVKKINRFIGIVFGVLILNCTSKSDDNSNRVINNRKEIINSSFDSLIIKPKVDSVVWHQYKILKPIPTDTLPYKNCKLVVYNNQFLKYYIDDVLKYEDSLIISKEVKYPLFNMKNKDSCIIYDINKKDTILFLQVIHSYPIHGREYFKKVK